MTSLSLCGLGNKLLTNRLLSNLCSNLSFNKVRSPSLLKTSSNLQRNSLSDKYLCPHNNTQYKTIRPWSYDHRISNMITFFILALLIAWHATGSAQECITKCMNSCPFECPSKCANDTIAITALDESIATIETRLKVLLAITINATNPPTEPSTYPLSSLLHSCEEIKTNWPDSPSDYYIIADIHGRSRQVYCHMESLCNSGGGWMRIAYLNMSDLTEECPPGFRLYNQNETRACGRPALSPAGYCQSVKFPSYDVSYSEVCGRVIGYQYGHPDGIDPRRTEKNNLNGAYVDGVSLTRGNPRQHIWTFVAALQDNSFHHQGHNECPCAPNSPVNVPSFIGNDYFCESGCSGVHQSNFFYSEDPLWDGKQCGQIEKACCVVPGLPWFHNTLDYPTVDYIEMRVCADENGTLEDSPVAFYEFYIK